MQKNTAALFLGTTQHVHEREEAMHSLQVRSLYEPAAMSLYRPRPTL